MVTRSTALISLPTYANARTGVWDGGLRIYNLHAGNSYKLRAALGKAAAGTGLCRIVIAGDSISVGHNVTIGEEDPGTVLRRHLAASGVPVSAFVYASNSDFADARWTIDGAWTGQSIIVASGAGHVATYVSDNPGTVVDIECLVGSAAFTYSIDGGTPVAINTTGSGDAKVVSITGLPDTPHTVRIVSVTGTNQLVGIGVRYPHGIDIVHAAQSGIDSENWSAAGYGPLTTTRALNPDVVLLELGANDWAFVSIATFKTQMQAIIDAYVADGVTVLLGATHDMDYAPTLPWTDFLDALYDLADTNDLALLDFNGIFGSFAESDGNGLMSDESHPSVAGYAVRAQAWAHVLAVPAARGGSATVSVYDTPGVYAWRKPAGCTGVRVQVIGTGSGGGSGRRGATGTRCDGGSGGSGGGCWTQDFPADLIDDQVTVTVGAGGAGGAARTANDTDGANGAVGGVTSFGTHLLIGAAANGGGGGTASGSGSPGFSLQASDSNGAQGGAGAAGTSNYFGRPILGASGGAGGGGISAGNTAFAGGESIGMDWSTGTAIGYGNAGAVNTAGATGYDGALMPGSGGSGGGASTTVAAGAGGHGGTFGAGGGGGGASRNGNNSGAGGAGGDGLVVVTALF